MADNQKLSGFGSLNTYWDVNRESSVKTLTLGVSPGPESGQVGFFGFVDVVDKGFWSEQNFKFRLSGPLHASFQWVSASALPNQKGRLGLFLNWNDIPSIKNALASVGIFVCGQYFHLIELDSDFAWSRGGSNLRKGGQIESVIAGAIPGTSGRLFYEGWLDLDIDHVSGKGVQLTPVGDFLVGYSALGNPTESGALRLVAELRYNQVFKRLQDSSAALAKVPNLNPWGLGLGASYFVMF